MSKEAHTTKLRGIAGIVRIRTASTKPVYSFPRSWRTMLPLTSLPFDSRPVFQLELKSILFFEFPLTHIVSLTFMIN